MTRFSFDGVCQHAKIKPWLGKDGANNLRGLLAHLEQEWSDPRWIAYGLATAKHETGADFRCRREFVDPKDPKFRKYEQQPLKNLLGNLQPGDGLLYSGRCCVQITGRRNYEQMGKLLKIDLVNNPDLALVPENSYRIMSVGMARGTFTGVGLPKYINANGCDFLNSRRIVNGMDRAQLIAGYARDFEEALTASRVQ